MSDMSDMSDMSNNSIYISPTITVSSGNPRYPYKSAPNPQYVQQQRIEALEKEMKEMRASFKAEIQELKEALLNEAFHK
jgi:hypothetical protein